MKVKIAEVNDQAEAKLPPNERGGSMIGVNYTEEYIEPMNVELEDGRKVSCKRRGLRIILSIGEEKGEGLMRRIANGPDPKNILHCALEEAAQSAGSVFTVENNAIYLEV